MEILILLVCLIIIIMLRYKSGAAEKNECTLETLKVRDESEIKTDLKYPIYCFQSLPIFSLKLPEYNNDDKEYFKYNLLKNVVLHPYRKNLLFSPNRPFAIGLFRFAEKINPTELIIMSSNIFVINYFLKHYPIKIHLFSMKLISVDNPLITLYDRMPEERDFKALRGIPLIAKSNFIYKNFNYRSLYSSVRYNAKFLLELHKKFEPLAALYMLKTYNHNISMEVPAGQILISPFSHMTIQPSFLVEVTGSKLVSMRINMQDIFCRIQLFNVCSRNLNYSNSGNYLTYDLYMQKKYLPPDYTEVIGPDPVINKDILSKTLESYYTENTPFWSGKKIFKNHEGNLSHLLVSDKTVDGSFFSGFIDETPEELPNTFIINNENKIDNINTSVSQILGTCFENMSVSFFLNDEYDIYFYIRYLGDIYITPHFVKKMEKYLRRTMYRQEIIENRDLKPEAIIFPYTHKPALDQGLKVFKTLVKKNYTTIWLESSCIIEFMIEFIHLLFPIAVINVIGASSDRIYVNNYEPIENYQNLFPEPGDLIWSMKNIVF